MARSWHGTRWAEFCRIVRLTDEQCRQWRAAKSAIAVYEAVMGEAAEAEAQATVDAETEIVTLRHMAEDVRRVPLRSWVAIAAFTGLLVGQGQFF